MDDVSVSVSQQQQQNVVTDTRMNKIKVQRKLKTLIALSCFVLGIFEIVLVINQLWFLSTPTLMKKCKNNREILIITTTVFNTCMAISFIGQAFILASWKINPSPITRNDEEPWVVRNFGMFVMMCIQKSIDLAFTSISFVPGYLCSDFVSFNSFALRVYIFGSDITGGPTQIQHLNMSS